MFGWFSTFNLHSSIFNIHFRKEGERMKCKDVQAELVTYLDKELSSMGQKTIETHLADCEVCSGELQELRGIIGATRQWEGITPSENWRQELQNKINSEKPRKLTQEIRHLRNAIDTLVERMERQNIPEVMTLEELASYLRIDPDTVWSMLDELPHFQIGYELRFKKSSIDEWIRFKENRLEMDAEDWYSGGNWFQEPMQRGRANRGASPMSILQY